MTPTSVLKGTVICTTLLMMALNRVSAQLSPLGEQKDVNHMLDSLLGFGSKSFANCSRIKNFAESVSQFTYCSLLKMVPYQLCRSCLIEYLVLQKTYRLLVDPTHVPDEGMYEKACPTDILSKDRFLNIRNYYKHSRGIWLQGNCDNCYQVTNDPEIGPEATFYNSQDAEQFFSLLQRLDECVSRNTTCDECRGNYTLLNDFYTNLYDNYGSHLCFDIIESMSSMRNQWNANLGCYVNKVQDISLLLLALVVVVMPLLFYLMGRILCRVKSPTLLQQKRMSRSFSAVQNYSETSPLINSHGTNINEQLDSLTHQSTHSCINLS